MEHSCKNSWCGQSFEISDADLTFLDMLSPVIAKKKHLIPPPTLCPDCRLQRRLALVNQLNLYERTCDLSGAHIISNVRPESPYKVYRQEDWHSDKWDAFSYGKEFDFKRPFFKQWSELLLEVPRPSLFTGYEYDENCEYTNHAGKNKNCYLIFDSDENRDCYYSYSINQCVNCVDCFRTRKSELCYECIDSVRCYGSAFLQDCDNCSDSMFLKNCTGCHHCLMCSNLRNKEYCVENKPVTQEDFEAFRKRLGSFTVLESAKERFSSLKLEFPQKFMHGVQNEDVLGDYLVNCKNAYHCFDTEDLWDGRYVYQGFMPLKNCMDVHECGDGELLYECSVSGYDIHSCAFCNHTLGSMHNLLYCSLCPHCKNCFGCIGLRRKEYCILNKQYTKEAFEALVPKLIAHMQGTSEWGEFFPVTTSTYAYNETLAQDYYPLTKKQVRERGWAWLDEPKVSKKSEKRDVDLPDDIASAQDDLFSTAHTCVVSGKLYKIIPQELAFLRSRGLPLPRRSFLQRHEDRMALRNPRKLWQRACGKCQAEIQTSYSPERPEIVYCEKCYLESVF